LTTENVNSKSEEKLAGRYLNTYLGQLKKRNDLKIKGIIKTEKVDICGIVKVIIDKLASETKNFTLETLFI
jgi:hypothetical protein